MKMLSLGWLAALLVPIGLALALLGFGLENQIARTSLQVLGLLVLGVAVWFGQQLLGPLEKDAQ